MGLAAKTTKPSVCTVTLCSISTGQRSALFHCWQEHGAQISTLAFWQSNCMCTTPWCIRWSEAESKLRQGGGEEGDGSSGHDTLLVPETARLCMQWSFTHFFSPTVLQFTTEEVQYNCSNNTATNMDGATVSRWGPQQNRTTKRNCLHVYDNAECVSRMCQAS